PYLKFLDILAEVNPLCRNRLINNFFINAVFRGNTQRKNFAKEHNISEPFFFVVSPTMRCNLHCVGCYAGNYGPRDELSFETVDRILTDAKTMGIYFVTVSGGEPFIRKDLLQLFGKHDDIYFQVFTNGTLIDAQLAEEIAGLGNIAPVLSCEGLQQETDYRRGRGTFQKIMDAMDYLKKAGVIFGISTVAASYNYSTLMRDQFYNLLLEKGVLFGWFFQYVPIGLNPDPKLMLNPRQRIGLHEKIKEIRSSYPIFLIDFWNDGPYVDGCLAGARSGGGYFHINANGDIEPCVFVHFAVDNIKNIYHRGGHLWDALNSRLFKKIRSGQPWNTNHQMPCMVIDNPGCLRNIVKKTEASPTHQNAESIVEDPDIVSHLNTYSINMQDSLKNMDVGLLKRSKSFDCIYTQGHNKLRTRPL
ncbi:MAG: radical SAM protein, partial [Deltaproteobacteria bacterium]|nr:radical SAM protein [Deltaproteobacteria bacterium]